MVEQQLSGIVAEEATASSAGPRCRAAGRPGTHGGASCRPDLLIVKLEAAGVWMQFRDVFEVDGAPVRDRDERLVRSLLEPPASVAAQKAAILRRARATTSAVSGT